MYEVPFLIWLSPEYQREAPGFARELATYANRPWQNSNLAYPVLDLAGVSFAGMDLRLDILSPSFIPQKRLIFDKDYAEMLHAQR